MAYIILCAGRDFDFLMILSPCSEVVGVDLPVANRSTVGDSSLWDISRIGLCMRSRTTIQVSENLRKELRRLSARQDLSYEEQLWAMVELFQELEPGRTLVSIPTDLANRLSEVVAETD